MNLGAYLERIGYDGPLETTPEVLAALHRAHLFAVPFETISIARGEPIQLDPAWLFDKIVVRRRGGFCYELNGLFAELLDSLGFAVTRLAGRVYNQRGELGIPFDHLALLVKTAERSWLADVGFGDSFLEPLPFEFDTDVACDRRLYRLSEVAQPTGDAPEFELHEQRQGASWRAQCRFDRKARALRDFEVGAQYHQTSPLSPFADRLLCSRPGPDGSRTTVRNFTVIETTSDGIRSERTLAGEQERADFLYESFGVPP